MKKTVFILSFLILNLLFSNLSFADNLEKLWYFKEEESSRKSLFKNYSKIDILAPQTFYLRFNQDKKQFYIESKMKDDIINFTKEKNIKVLPLLANISFNKKGNEYFDRNLIHKLLDDEAGQTKIIKEMIEIAEKINTTPPNLGGKFKPMIGWQLDLEAIDGSYKDKFTAFAKKMEEEFNKNNLITSAAIVSKISDNPKDYEKAYWDKWASVYDYKKLGETLDFISVMAYDEPKSKGPVATIDWSKKVLNYSLANIPANKISFGIPVYAWAYRSEDLKKRKKHFAMTNYSLIDKYLTGEFFSKITGSGRNKTFGDIPWISYNRNKKNYTIWYEDKISFERKLQNITTPSPSLVKERKIRGFSVWVLGDEDPKIWELF